MGGKRLAGTYRAVVEDNVDPESRRRMKVTVPAAKVESVWAEACLPPVPEAFVHLPSPGNEVWVVFEGGDPGRPVWIGQTAGVFDIRGNGTVYVRDEPLLVRAPSLTTEVGTIRVHGSIQCDTLLATSVAAASYTPGAGNQQ